MPPRGFERWTPDEAPVARAAWTEALRNDGARRWPEPPHASRELCDRRSRTNRWFPAVEPPATLRGPSLALRRWPGPACRPYLLHSSGTSARCALAPPTRTAAVISLSFPLRVPRPRRAVGRSTALVPRLRSKDRPAQETNPALRSGTAFRTSEEAPRRTATGHTPRPRATSPARNQGPWPATPAHGPASDSLSSYRAGRSWRPRSGPHRSRPLPQLEAPLRVSAARRLAGLTPARGRVAGPPDQLRAAHAAPDSTCGHLRPDVERPSKRLPGHAAEHVADRRARPSLTLP